MANEINFTEEEQEQLLKEQEKWTRQDEFWENLDEKQISAEIFGVNTRCCNFAFDLKKLINNLNYEEVEGECNALWLKDLSSEGWIPSFHKTNSDVFPRSVSDFSRPDWYASLSPEQKKTYDIGLQYHHDSMWLLNTCEDLRQMLMEMDLEGAYRTLLMEKNMKDGGLDKEEYKNINEYADDAAKILFQSMDTLERYAKRSKEYYEKNVGKLDKSALKKGYRQERIKDYQDYVEKFNISSILNFRSDGRFTLKPGEQTKFSVIDRYTKKVVDTEGVKDAMLKTIEKCERIKSTSLAESLKNCKTQACASLAGAFEELVDAVMDFANAAAVSRYKFEKAEDDTSYCYMKLLDSLYNMPSRYSLDASRYGYDPLKYGTKYKDLFIALAKALSEQGKDFAENYGRTDF